MLFVPYLPFALLFRARRLLVASQEGYLYVYQVPSMEGGDFRLIIRHDLRNSEASRTDASTAPSDSASTSSVDAHGMYSVCPSKCDLVLHNNTFQFAGESLPVPIPAMPVVPMTAATITVDGLIIRDESQSSVGSEIRAIVAGSVSEDEFM